MYDLGKAGEVGEVSGVMLVVKWEESDVEKNWGRSAGYLKRKRDAGASPRKRPNPPKPNTAPIPKLSPGHHLQAPMDATPARDLGRVWTVTLFNVVYILVDNQMIQQHHFIARIVISSLHLCIPNPASFFHRRPLHPSFISPIKIKR